MSRRNSREGKARRRAERAAQRDQQHIADLADVHSYDELVRLAEAGETLPCGCDAHALLHDLLDPGPYAS
jgi:hypothetical protein